MSRKVVLLVVVVVVLQICGFDTTVSRASQSLILPFAPRYVYNPQSDSFSEDVYYITNACEGTRLHVQNAHYAVDIGMNVGTPIYAPVSGNVVFAGYDTTGYGLLVRIIDNENREHWLAHLSHIYVNFSGPINQGSLIGLSGETGNGPAHLHYHVQRPNGTQQTDAIDVRGQLPGVTWFDSDYCVGTSPGSTDGKVHPSQIPNGVTANSCRDFYNIGFQGVWGFDAPNCQGNILFGPLYPGEFNADFQGVGNRLKSISAQAGLHFWLYGNPDNNDLAHCHENDMWNLDVDFYNQSSTNIGWDPDYQMVNVGGVDWVSSGTNMVSRVVVTTDPCPNNADGQLGSISYGRGGVVKPDWLLEFYTNVYAPNLEIFSRVLDVPDYNRQRVLFDGRVLYETYEDSFTHTEDMTNIPVGDHIIRVEYSHTIDGLSWDTAEYYEETFHLADIVPPTTVANVPAPDGNNGWFVNPLTVTLTATDNVGVANTYYRINGGEFVAGTSISLVNDGIYTIEYYSTDVNSNTEQVQSVMVYLDQTPPETAGTVTGPRDVNGLFRDNVVADIMATDNLSGVDFTRCSYDNKVSWQTLVGTQIFLNGNGVYQFYCQSQDVAGNVEPVPLDSGPIIINMYLIYAANGSSDPDTPSFLLRSTGNYTTLTGDIYSQGLVELSRNTSATINGTIETGVLPAVVTSNTGSNFGPIVPIDVYVPALSYPFGYYWQRCDQVYENGLELNSVGVGIQGVICVVGTLDVTAVNVIGDVTFVVYGTIEFNPTASEFITNDPDNGMLMYAAGDIHLHGTGTSLMGLVYTPGTIYQSGTSMTVRGSYVASRVIIDRATGFNMSYEAAFAAQTFPLPLGNLSFADPAESLGIPGPNVNGLPVPEPSPEPTSTPTPTNTPVPVNPPLIQGVNLTWLGGTTVNLAFVFENADPGLIHSVGWTCDNAVTEFSGAFGPVNLNHTCPGSGSVSAVITVYGMAGTQPAITAVEVVIPEPTSTVPPVETSTPVSPTETQVLNTATPTPSTPLPICSMTYEWTRDDRVEFSFSWANADDDWHQGTWGDVFDFYLIGPAGSEVETHSYMVNPIFDNPTEYTVSMTITGAGETVTCTEVIDFMFNPFYQDEYGVFPTDTPIPEASATPDPTVTETPAPTEEDTGTPIPTVIGEPTATETSVPTATETAVPTNTPEPLPTATLVPSPTIQPPNCSMTYVWSDDDEVDFSLVWSGGYAERHYGWWGDGDDFSVKSRETGKADKDHRYDVDPDDGDPLVYTVSLTVNGPGGSYTCSETINFENNPRW